MNDKEITISKRVRDYLESQGVSVGGEQTNGEVRQYEISFASPAGQDCRFTVDVGRDAKSEWEADVDFHDSLFSLWRDYDASQEAYLWLGPDGHGKNGAPYDMKDVYDDMVAVERTLEELEIGVSEIAEEERNEEA